jgi:sodium/bile acid cotransporter 7
MKLPVDWFVPALAAAVGLAWLMPGPGARGGALHAATVNQLGVALIFWLSGLSLPFAALRDGALRWRLHALIQASTFLLFPALGFALSIATRGWLPDETRLGFIFLGALSSTVSSAVALTAAAGGNVAVAVLNASLSSLLGVLLTPLWLSLAVAASGAHLPLGKVFRDLLMLLVVPLAAGQACRPLLAAWAARHRRRLAVVDRLVILFMVYSSFCDATLGGVWSRSGPGAVALVLLICAALFALVLALILAACRAAREPRDERIAAAFIGSTKSLATGVPMAQILFAGQAGLGLILLPIMLYHPLQLVICGVLAARWRGREAH